jgi:hypothetical protein
MNFTTQMAEKLRESGYPVVRGTLYETAKQGLNKASRNPFTALDGFVDSVLRDTTLSEAFVRQCALAYLMLIRDDLAGTAVVKPAAQGGGHKKADAHPGNAPAAPTGIGGNADVAGAGQSGSDTHGFPARAAALHHGTPSQTAGGGHQCNDPHAGTASPTSPAAGSPKDVYVHDHRRAKPGRAGSPDIGIEKPNRLLPNKPRVSPADLLRSRTAIAKSVLDTLFVNGRPVGDITAAEALAWAEKQGRESRIVHALAHGLPPNARIRDWVKPEEAERRVKEVEAAHAA